ncbi:nuclear transport factor 2 family protein [Actinoplanes sp. LDG1-06]|uniref:Nuclear transport factor 2 family protein n=1 Tax=Paractinoplanes ovalisporus TaxID=2810368 RepID=A0ABS2AA68_9ACTN|nr:nuclear transport factor 2 family protein [Actinoplanes ovalisporus]MBM2616713.1 nuclear transport factor 2 family protein [Actinoplanes ovalisporus]
MQDIREVIEARAARLSEGDVKAFLSYSADEVRTFDLAPPLGSRVDGNDPAPTERWLATFEAPPRREVTQLEITVDGDVAFATSYDSMSATPRGTTDAFTLWYRVTLGLRRIDGRWLVVHEHESVPFLMDGSFAAAIDLTP